MKYYLSVKPDKVASEVANMVRQMVEVVSCPKDADIIAAIGGDGSLIHTIYHYRHYDKPFVGVNGGSEGAHCLIRRHNLASGFNALENMTATRLHFLVANYNDNTELAVQDIRLERRTGKTIRVRIELGDQVLSKRHAGDGILVANALGSSGYNRSAGGETLPLTSAEILLTPICPTFSEVAFDNLMKSITIGAREVRITPEETVCLVADNRDVFIEGGVEVRVRRSKETFRFFPKETR